jgi:hypothetical protein
MTQGSTGGDRDYDAKLLAGGAETESCDASTYSSCKRASGKDWHSFMATGVNHWTIVDRFFEEVLRRFFMTPPPGLERPVGEPESAEAYSQELAGMETWAAGACKGFVAGSVPYAPDDKILCRDKPCCMQPTTLQQIERTKTLLPAGMSLMINDAARTTASQRDAYLDFLGGGNIACGPRALRGQNLAAKVPDATIPPKTGYTEAKRMRMDAAIAWINAEGGQYKDAIMDLRQYSGCPHVHGKAVDIQVKGRADDEAILALRNLMCSVGWANYGAEWWHYEYLTSSYNEAKKKNRCYFAELAGRTGKPHLRATVEPGYA